MVYQQRISRKKIWGASDHGHSAPYSQVSTDWMADDSHEEGTE